MTRPIRIRVYKRLRMPATVLWLLSGVLWMLAERALLCVSYTCGGSITMNGAPPTFDVAIVGGGPDWLRHLTVVCLVTLPMFP